MRAIPSLVVTICLLLVAAGTARAQSTRPRGRAKSDPILIKINSGDPAQQREAAEAIRALLKSDPHEAQHNLKFYWLWPMLYAKMYREGDELAAQAILAHPELTQNIVGLQRWRPYALRKLNRNEEALVEAKRYFNLSKMTQTEEALGEIILALQALHPDDPAIVERLKTEQVRAATRRPATAPASAQHPAGVLDSIRVDPAPYEKALARYAAPEKYEDHVARGNILLLMDRTREALAEMERAAQIAPEERKQVAMLDVARAMRAADQGVARANAWVLDQGAQE